MQNIKKIILQPFKVKEHTDQVDNVREKLAVDDQNELPIEPFTGWYDENQPVDGQDEEAESSVPSETTPSEATPNFDVGMYDEDYRDHSHTNVQVKNTDSLTDRYNFDSNYMVTLKAAKLSGKVKAPYIVMKTMDKSSEVKEIDTIYKTDAKLKYNEYKQNVILGFILGDDAFRTIQFNPKHMDKYVGTVNEDFPIFKKKPFNSKRVGYIKLSENNPNEDYYLAVVKKRKPFAFVPYIVAALVTLIILTQTNWGMIGEGLKKDIEHLKNIGSTVTEVMTVHDWSVYHESKAVVGSDGTVVLNIKTSEFLNTHYKVFMYIDDAEIYASEELESGASLDSINVPILNNLESGEYTCKLVCKLYETVGIPILEVSNFMTIVVPEK